MKHFNKAETAKAREALGELLKPGDTVRTVLGHVSKSGMTRDVQCLIARDSEIIDITSKVAAAIGGTYNAEYDSVRVTGCGLDVGFGIVYDLGRRLYPDDEYALKHRWI